MGLISKLESRDSRAIHLVLFVNFGDFGSQASAFFTEESRLKELCNLIDTNGSRLIS